MKLPIIPIALLVLLSLLGIFAFQGYWLHDVYRTTQKRADTAIRDAIQNADHIEVFFRADSLGREYASGGGATQHGSVSFSTSFDKEVEENQIIEKTYSKTDATDSVHFALKVNQHKRSDTTFHRQNRNVFGESGIGLDYHSLTRLGYKLQQSLHTAMDPFTSISLARFDSVMESDLKASGFPIRHYSKIVVLRNDSVIASSLPASVDTTKLKRWRQVYDIEYKNAYIIFTEPTDKAVLHQMVGILISSFLMMLIIIFSFGYLIRVILRQRSLDEMKSDFTNNITHELKTPIAVAYAANDALLHFKQGEVKEQRDRYLQISMEQLQRLSHLVEQILSMSMERRRTLTLHLEKIVIRELMKPLIEQQKLKAKKTVEVIYVEEPDGLTVVADRTHLGNIISNLLDNAIKYSGESVTVAICCRTDDQGNIVVSVRDNGIGISADSQKHIFEKFYRVPTGNKHDSKGYGLGLYYVNTILTKMNGSIRVESEPGKGSIFIVTLWKKKG